MSLDTSESFRSIMDSILVKPIGRMMTNPLSLALMITSIIMLVVVYSYDDQHIFRTLLRVFGICTMFLFVNNHILLEDINARQLNPDQQNMIRILERGTRPTSGRVSDASGGHTYSVGASGGHSGSAGSSGSPSEESDEDNESMVVSKSRGSYGGNYGAHILEQLPPASSLVVSS